MNCIFLLIAKAIYDVALWFVFILSVAKYFGLHFYYDTTLLTAVLSVLDMVLFPFFLLSEHEKIQRKQK
ncbi:hypothetical protein OESDEN_06509 [Oesophagostomum dentatum]|uniref:Uncharacterized protein n=1 Tax=Oesophagostomum dentatum TaxID=61180 RepID=A0A0B1TDZ3_OESDE|nr:hypothetical protein OESDEN_06509 [Oesophagostomum dentatum]